MEITWKRRISVHMSVLGLRLVIMIGAAQLFTCRSALSLEVLLEPCSAVPLVPGIDQSPSLPEEYGKCTSKVESTILNTSNW